MEWKTPLPFKERSKDSRNRYLCGRQTFYIYGHRGKEG